MRRLAALILFFCLCLPLSAAAHVKVKSSTPAPGSTLREAPTAVTLTFSGPVEQRFGKFALNTPDGKRVDLAGVAAPGAAESEDTVRLDLPPLVPGAYVLEWRVVAGDGHPARGELRFTYAP